MNGNILWIQIAYAYIEQKVSYLIVYQYKEISRTSSTILMIFSKNALAQEIFQAGSFQNYQLKKALIEVREAIQT